MAPSRHDWKIVDWDVKPQHNQSKVQEISNSKNFNQKLQRKISKSENLPQGQWGGGDGAALSSCPVPNTRQSINKIQIKLQKI